jgi:S1-C subfamily serine protease
LRALVVLLALWFSVCCAHPAARLPPDHVLDATAVTVALLIDKDEHRYVCAGVWVADEWILTANHCLVDEADDGSITDVPSAAFEIAESIGFHYRAEVVFRDPEHDLALLRAKTWPIHRTAVIAYESPAPGTHVHVVGHPGGFLYTYATGQVMAPVRHDARLPDGPDLQVQVPVAPGNSGGGAFDDEGHLVGLMDGMLETLPGEGFFVPVEVIHAFLKASHL